MELILVDEELGQMTSNEHEQEQSFNYDGVSTTSSLGSLGTTSKISQTTSCIRSHEKSESVICSQR